MLALLLLSILTLAFGARLVEADGMILPFSSLPYAPLAYALTALADTINNCRVDSFADPVTIHFAATMGTTSLQQYDSVVFSNAYDCFYAKTLADIDGYTSSSLDSKVKSALTSMPMIGNMPRTYQSYWLVYDRYMINAYRWSQQWNIETAKWNETQAAEEAINCYHKAGRALLGLDLDRGWQYGNRYYDENGQTLDIMNKLGSSSDALAIWNYLNSAHWNGQIYAYTPGGGFECEVGPFAMLIGYYHATNPTIPYFDRISLDLYNKMLKNGWSSPAWSSSPGVMKHASTNPEKRLENTLDGFTALQAYYCLGSTDYKQAFQSLLTDSPKAWEALVSSPLYSSGKFSWREGQSVSDAATASGMMLLLLEGVVPDTGCLAIPLNEWRYQDQATMLPYTHFRFDYSSRRIRIPVFAGSIKFQFGTSVANATFTSNGIYEVQFSSDWNNVIGVNFVSPLSDQFYYLQPTGIPPPPPSKPAIYIMADGHVDPPDAPITTFDNVTYTFTGNILDEIAVERDNIVVDGAAFDSKGISISGRNNVTIKNTNIRDFTYGIYLHGSSNNNISGNNITANNYYGICLSSSSNNSVSRNNITANNGATGIRLSYSSNNSVSGNTFVNGGLEVSDSYGNVVTDNLVNGKPLVYLEEVSDYAVEDAGQVILVKCNNVTVENLNLSNTAIGVQLWETNNTTISGNNITNNGYGVGLGSSSNNNIFHNNFINNTSQVYSSNSANVWDDGYPSGGNFWSDYAGVDLHSGPYQNESGSDGMGDTSYNQDHYPLMNSWPSGWKLDFAGPTNHPIVDFAVHNGSLYAAADNRLYVKDGSSWNVIDAPAFVISLEPYEDKLIIGGQGGLYCYDGTSFALIFSVPTYIRILGSYNDTLYAGTMLDNPPKLYHCYGLAENPAEWHVDTGFSDVLNFSGAFGSIDSFAVYGNVMYVGSGGTLYSFNGTQWSTAKSYDDACAFLDMQVYNGKLYLATRDQAWRKPLYQGGTGFSGRVIEYDGENWTTVLDHDYWVYSLEVYDNKLYAGTANKILTYNGTSWETSFNATEGAYYAISMITYDGKIYAGMGNGYIFADPAPAKQTPRP